MMLFPIVYRKKHTPWWPIQLIKEVYQSLIIHIDSLTNEIMDRIHYLLTLKLHLTQLTMRFNINPHKYQFLEAINNNGDRRY